ncbi:hypothetical protein LCGC14_2375160 [marine sediment metagenome]|uniref:Uncharacterized protein n=1 Tax=marine sediment metagenome TaxID=412755 RepID=A0A0F9C2L1_9ZZZZ
MKENLWCPYCDEVVPFWTGEWYDDVRCTKCKRNFTPDEWPIGLDIHTGELIGGIK